MWDAACNLKHTAGLAKKPSVPGRVVLRYTPLRGAFPHGGVLRVGEGWDHFSVFGLQKAMPNIPGSQKTFWWLLFF